MPPPFRHGQDRGSRHSLSLSLPMRSSLAAGGRCRALHLPSPRAGLRKWLSWPGAGTALGRVKQFVSE